MVFVIDAENRAGFQKELQEMYKDRKRIFVDLLKWDVPVVDDQYEMDQFDHENTHYLLITDPETGKHTASVRLLPTREPHLLGNVFPSLCEHAVPVANDIWEISRFTTAPGLNAKKRKVLHEELVTALVEFGLLYGVKGYTCIAEMAWLSKILAMGWVSDPLGTPKKVMGQMIAALYLHVTPNTLQLFRNQWNTDLPILQLPKQQIAA